MNRRGFFKVLGAAVAGVVCAPLAKLIPEPKAAVSPWARPMKIGSTINIRYPQHFYIRADGYMLDNGFEWDDYEKLINVARDE